jgi:hypothetical protein
MEFLQACEFSLTDREIPGEIVARLRIPAGTQRVDVRSWLATTPNLQVLKQQCFGDETETTAWSKVIFLAPLNVYQSLRQQCHESNLSVVRQFTAVQMAELERLEVQRQRRYSQEDLRQLTLAQLKTAARLLNISDRAALTKNKAIAEAELFPLLEGLPAVVVA